MKSEGFLARSISQKKQGRVVGFVFLNYYFLVCSVASVNKESVTNREHMDNDFLLASSRDSTHLRSDVLTGSVSS